MVMLNENKVTWQATLSTKRMTRRNSIHNETYNQKLAFTLKHYIFWKTRNITEEAIILNNHEIWKSKFHKVGETKK